MQFLLSAAQEATNRMLSGLFGSISITAWICLLLPQLMENYKSQSANGLSMLFLFVWLIGDIANLCGALFTHLAPPAIALAIYFCFADIVLILQSSYYNAKNARLAARASTRRSSQRNSDDEPLLGRRSSSAGLPGSHRRNSRRESTSGFDPLRRIITGEDETPQRNPWFSNVLSLAAVWIVGAAGYFASAHMGLDLGSDGEEGPSASGTQHTVGMALGYASAVCYLCARIPQIIKNYQEKSCDGLSLLFFLFSLTGNLTYGASLVAYSQTREELIKDLPWLVGSFGTIVEDLVIFFQFRIYGDRGQTKPAVEDGEHAENGNGNGAVYGTA